MEAITLKTPNAIEVLIHCHCCPEPHPRIEAPAVQEALQYLRECGAIKPGSPDGAWTTTALGAAWLRALERVPLPRCVYVDADGEILGDSPWVVIA